MSKKLIPAALGFSFLLISWIGLTQLSLSSKSNSYKFQITNLSDQEYPDNPDIGHRSIDYQNSYFTQGRLDLLAREFFCNLSFHTVNSDSIWINDLDLSEFIPTIPEGIRNDGYLSYISCINQEWNRNQVRFNSGQFGTNNSKITRIDVARNCLNAYLWEVIVYIEQGGKTAPFAHGWFDFPHELYAELFEEKNELPFSTYQAPLEQWEDPESKPLNLNALRTVTETLGVSFSDNSDEMYPLEKARKKKFKEIVYPTSFSTMRDLQSDSTLFATFSPPGFYNKNDPRTTELGRFRKLKSIDVKKVRCNASENLLIELKLTFIHQFTGEETVLIFGGLDLNDFPLLPPAEVNSGWKTSMGIGNHTFYEDFTTHISNKTKENPYYGFLLDGKGNWLDSHKIGIDGPIFHFADEKRTELHLWLLSFERHALVGHYVINFKD